MKTYRVEFFYIGIKGDNKEVVDSWEAEEWRYPNLTVTDYMECSDWELSPMERISGIIVTLFVDDVATSSAWWHEGMNGEELDTIF